MTHPATDEIGSRRRIRLTVAYDGTALHGWQRQPGLRTVQSELEAAAASALREVVEVAGASRTDAGVHAWGQAAVLDTATRVPVERLARVLNAELASDIRVREAVSCDAGFHPRFDAVGKLYRYTWDLGTVESPFWGRFVCPVRGRPDVAAMVRAARHLLGEHDFRSFQNTTSQEPPTTVRRLEAVDVRSEGAWLHLEVVGNAFLYNMVRNLAGTLLDVGLGRRREDSLPATLAARDRRAAGTTAPPQGLCLVEACFDPARYRTLVAKPEERPPFLAPRGAD